MSRKVIVFGATGEIGSRVAAGCVQVGYQVTGVSRGINTRHRIDVDGVRLLHGDKYDESFLKDIAKDNAYDTVIDTSVTLEGVKLYHRYFHDVQNVIICSSTGTFVPLNVIPADETHPWRKKTSINFYHQSIRDAWGLDRHAEDGFPFTVLRPTCITGYGRVPLELWGSRNVDFYRQLWDNQPIVVPEQYDQILLQAGCNDDIATAFVKAVGKGREIEGEVFIISCQSAITLKMYLESAMEFLGSTSEVQPTTTETLLKYGHVDENEFRFLLEDMSFSIGEVKNQLQQSRLARTSAGVR